MHSQGAGLQLPALSVGGYAVSLSAVGMFALVDISKLSPVCNGSAKKLFHISVRFSGQNFHCNTQAVGKYITKMKPK